jgi:hypothetical protein
MLWMLVAGAYRWHIENQIRADNTALPNLQGVTYTLAGDPRGGRAG